MSFQISGHGITNCPQVSFVGDRMVAEDFAKEMFGLLSYCYGVDYIF